jgi:TRAP-type C4-dicarboxylate transport system substrate-binding protein
MTARNVFRSIAALVLAASLAPPPAAGQTVVRLATLVPEGSVWDKALKEMGAEWSQATQGRVQLRIYPGGVAGDEPDMVRKMRIGQIQAAALTTSGLGDLDASFQVFGIPMFLDSYGELMAVLDSVGPTLRRRLEDKGFVMLSWGHGGWVYFFTKEPVATLADLKKTKMFAWAGDDRMVQLWKQEGFQPVALAATDIMTGLNTGMINAFPTTPLLALTLQWYKLTPHMVGVGLAPLVGGIVVTKQTWNKISEADRAAIQASCRRAERRLARDVPRQDTTSVAEMRKRGLTVVEVPAARTEEWRQAAASFAARMRAGIVPPEILDQVQRQRDAYRRGARGVSP